jgi:hypothetical protein
MRPVRSSGGLFLLPTTPFPDARVAGVTRLKLRVACQLPLHLSPVMIPLHRPVPELPASRPLPVATEAPTEILTATLPPGPIPPVTLPPPADDTRLPATIKGTLLVALQLPFWVANTTFQVPS